MFIKASVDGLPPKKDGSSSMWHKDTELPRLMALRSAVAARIGDQTDVPYAGPVSLRLTIWADRASGDLDNFVAGVCDALMAAHPSTGVAAEDWPDVPPRAQPGLPLVFGDDRTVDHVTATRRPPGRAGERYTIVVQGLASEK